VHRPGWYPLSCSEKLAVEEPATAAIFISYRRANAAGYAGRIADDLVERFGEGAVYYDVAGAQPGRPIHERIRSELADARALLVVIGPGWASTADEAGRRLDRPDDLVRLEIETGLTSSDVMVIPVLVGGAVIPRAADVAQPLAPLVELEALVLTDSRWRDDFATLLSALGEVVPAELMPQGALGGAIPQPPRHLVPRPGDIDGLKARLLADDRGPVVLHGMVGIGKTVLASAVAHDEEVRRAFPDGVVWLALGREPDLLTRQAQLAETLGDGIRAFNDVQQGKARLAELLARRACLLVLDDLWEADHAAAFTVLGPGCRLLVTTRVAGLVRALDGVDQEADALPEDAALQLLSRWAGLQAANEAAREVVRACGGLPLALAMVGAMVRGRSDRWDTVLRRLRTADLARIRQQLPNYPPYPDLLKALQVSVAALSDGDRARYVDFAVFPEDVAVPTPVLTMLWRAEGVDEDDARDTLDELIDRSLIRRDKAQRLAVHDLLFDYLRSEAGDLAPRHERLLDAYRGRCPCDWPSGPDDGYFFDHLVAHMIAAGWRDEMRRLLTLSDASGRNAWHGAKTRATGQIAGYLADLERARGIAETDRDAAWQARCALQSSSVHDANARIAPLLLDLCLREGILGEREALDAALLKPDPLSRVRALVQIAPSLASPERDAVIAAHFSAARRSDDTPLLLELVTILPADLVTDAVTAAGTIDDNDDRARYVTSLARQISEPDLDAALSLARSIEDPLGRVRALRALASRQPGRESVLDEIRAAIAQMAPTAAAVAARCELARIDPRKDGVLDEALEIAVRLESFGDLQWALEALAELGASLVSPDHVAVALDAVERSYAHEDGPGDADYATALATLGPLLTTDQRGPIEALVDALRSREGSSPLGDMAAMRLVPLLTRFLPPEKETPALDAYVETLVSLASSSSWWDRRSRLALDALADVPVEFLDRAVARAERIRDAERRAEVLTRLVPRLPRPRREAVLGDELDRARTLSDEPAQARALAALARWSANDSRRTIARTGLDIGQAFKGSEDYFVLVASLVPVLPRRDARAALEEALVAARAIDDAYSRARALATLAPALDEDQVHDALADARALGKLALAAFVPRVPAAERPALIDEVLEGGRIETVEFPRDFVAALRAIAGHLDEKQVASAVALTDEMGEFAGAHRTAALEILGTSLPDDQRDAATSIAVGIEDDLSYVRAVGALAPSVPDSERALAVEVAERLDDPAKRARAWAAIGPVTPEPGVALTAALDAALSIEADAERADTLVELLPLLPSDARADASEQVLRACLGSRLDRASLLDRIAGAAPAVHALGGPAAVAETARAIQETAAAWP
jgi:hypothetical protein